MNPHFKQALRKSWPVIALIVLFCLLLSLFSCQRSLSFTDKSGTDWHVQGNRIESVDSLGVYKNRKVAKAYRRFNHMGSLDKLVQK